ncbi:MAG TPA: branched-chain amino acid ABC transporter permease [Coriobacteriia bacterium]
MAESGDKKRSPIATALGSVPRWVYLAGALVLAILFPLLNSAGVMDMLWIRVAIRSLTFVLLALGLNVVMGETGLLNLGYVAFFAIGAYTTALLSSPSFGFHWSFWLLLLLSTALAMVAGLLVGLPTLRLRGDYLAIVTLAFGEIVRTVFLNATAYTGGAAGVPAIYAPNIFGWVVDQPAEFYYLILFFVVLVVVGLTNVKNSRIGRAWNALREDEIAAVHSGINATRTKILAMVISAGVAGLAGCLFAYYQQFINPTYFLFTQSVIVVCMVVLGGMGSIPGAVLGAIALDSLPDVIRATFSDWLPRLFGPAFMSSWPAWLQSFFIDFERYRMLLFGIVVVLVVIFRPEGLLPDTLWRSETHEQDPREQERTRQTLFDIDEGNQDLEA